MLKHKNLPIRPSETASIRAGVPVDTTLREISMTVVCGRFDSEVRSVATVCQTVTVEPSVTITAIEPLLSLTDIAECQSEMIFLAMDVTNHSGAMFTYTASFDMCVSGLCAFRGLRKR